MERCLVGDRDHEFASDVRPVQVSSEQPNLVQLAVAQWLDQALIGGRTDRGLVESCQESAGIARSDPLA